MRTEILEALEDFNNTGKKKKPPIGNNTLSSSPSKQLWQY